MIVWEEKWHTEGWPDLGDYVQIRHCDQIVESDVRVSEGTVVKIDLNEGWLFLCPEIPEDHARVALEWRRGALPEYKSVVRRASVDA